MLSTHPAAEYPSSLGLVYYPLTFGVIAGVIGFVSVYYLSVTVTTHLTEGVVLWRRTLDVKNSSGSASRSPRLPVHISLDQEAGQKARWSNKTLAPLPASLSKTLFPKGSAQL